ncbi:MAG: AAA family ATPase [Thermoplasmata archaeon]|nr:AAA family ATPase [Thermoplasmata archaeon]
MRVLELERSAYDDLLRWKEQDGASSALLNGAPCTGKTHLARKFAEAEYRTHIFIDFADPPEGVIDAFEHHGHDIGELFGLLEGIYGIELRERGSAIVLDGVENYPRAWSLTKHMVEYGRYDIIATGRRLVVEARRRNLLIPSEVDHIEVRPLDFREFLRAVGEEGLLDGARERVRRMEPMGDAHPRLSELFRLYMQVGGMPEAVSEYIQSGDMAEVEKVKRGIIGRIREVLSDEPKALLAFDSVPSQLRTRSRTFMISCLGAADDFGDPDEALLRVDRESLVNMVLNSGDPGRSLFHDGSFRLYMFDTGLLHTMAAGSIPDRTMAENAAVQELVSAGRDLMYYSRPRRRRRTGMDVDLLLWENLKLSPVAVRSTGSVSHKCLGRFVTRFGRRIGPPRILYSGDMREMDGFAFLPLYLAGMLRSHPL